MEDIPFAERVVLTIARSRSLDRLAIRALLKASELLGLALGVRLAALRDSGEPLQQAFSELETHQILARCFDEAGEILASRWDKIPDKRRPQYIPEQRYRILRLKRLLGWGKEETARRFRVSVETIARWERETSSNDDTNIKLVRPSPPPRRYADVVRELVRTMRLAGFGGYERIAQTLARAGLRISKRTVGRVLREKAPSPRAPETLGLRNVGRAVRALFPNHVFLMDLTEVSSLFGIFRFRLALVFDAFSRMPLAARVFSSAPSAVDLLELLRWCSLRYGPPRHLVTDHGPQFTSAVFRDGCRALGIRQRFGAIGEHGSIALLERFWRTLKELLHIRAFPPLVRKELEQRLETVLFYYTFLRPHQGIGGATPAEVYFGHKPRHLYAVTPLRGRPGEGPRELPFQIRFLDPERRLPVLIKAA